MMKVDSDVAEQQRMKEAAGDPDDSREKEPVGEEDLKGEGEKAETELDQQQAETEIKRPSYEKYLEWKRRKEEEEERKRNPEKITDPYAFEARMFRQRWDKFYLNNYGSFDKNTEIPCKRFTHNLPPRGGNVSDTLQVFYVKVGEKIGGLQWLLEVFGMVALRDSLDYNRNIIFERKRDNCQILTDQSPYLALTGPVRTVMLYGPVIFEASLYVKSAIEFNDKELSLIATSLGSLTCLESRLIRRRYRSRLSTLELSVGHITYSVEATIEVRVTSGSWPDGFRCRFEALTDSIEQSVVLLETADDHVTLTGDGISLSRQVVSVESHGEMIILATITNGCVVGYTDKMVFKPQTMGASSMGLGIVGDCMLEIAVCWSRFLL